MKYLKNLTGAALLFLMVLLQGCASVYSAPSGVNCEHPVVQVRTNADLVQGLADYYSALELCNLMQH